MAPWEKFNPTEQPLVVKPCPPCKHPVSRLDTCVSILQCFSMLRLALLVVGYSVIVTLTGLPIGYSVIVALTDLLIGCSVIVALTVSSYKTCLHSLQAV